MRIAVANSKFASPHLGGGVTSLLTLLEGLSDERRISVDAFQTPPVEKIDLSFEYEVHAHEPPSVPVFHWADGYVSARSWAKYFSENVKDRYDLSVCQGTLGAIAVNEVDADASVLFIRSLISTGYYQYHPDRTHPANFLRADIGGKLQYPFVLRNHRLYTKAVENADAVVANSEFTASKIEELYGVSPEVVYPPISIKDYETEHDEDGSILMVNPRSEYKGGDIFLDIAESMPDEEFRLVGTAPDTVADRADSLGNVTHVEWCEDMREEYSRAKVVVVPSRSEEPFGRVAAEAMVSGIPCVVSNRGGLPEVVGDLGYKVDEVESVKEWVKGIEDVVGDSRTEERKRRVREEFSAEVQVDRFLGIVDDIVEEGVI